jgi:hypothetical protein
MWTRNRDVAQGTVRRSIAAHSGERKSDGVIHRRVRIAIEQALVAVARQRASHLLEDVLVLIVSTSPNAMLCPFCGWPSRRRWSRPGSGGRHRCGTCGSEAMDGRANLRCGYRSGEQNRAVGPGKHAVASNVREARCRCPAAAHTPHRGSAAALRRYRGLRREPAQAAARPCLVF